MKETIRNVLLQVEAEHNVQILYACESGSRCWGFASKDSDYDVRFIYARRTADYLAGMLTNERDTLEIPAAFPLDINGWDLPKALKLFWKCNPPEWLRSPMVYKSNDKFVNQLRPLMQDYYNYSAMCYHYFHMASGNNRKYLQGPEVWTKKYLYVLRPLLSVEWVRVHNVPPPLDFKSLARLVLGNDASLLVAIEDLLNKKLTGKELGKGPRVDVISEFIGQKLNELEGRTWLSTKKERPWEPLQELFIDTLRLG
jgi:predicted nucleotidyltransferase